MKTVASPACSDRMTRENRLIESARGLKDTRRLIYCALLIALQTAVNSLASIPVGSTIRISFGYIAVAANAVLLGPVPAVAGAMVSDLLGCIIHPIGPFFPGFTLSAGLGALVYGLVLYQRPITIWRVLLAKLLIDVLVNVLLNTFWLKILYGKAFFAVLPGRLLKNLIQYPVDALLLFPCVRWFSSIKGQLLL